MTAHIVIVEDDRVSRMRLAAYLRQLGYRVTDTEGAEEMEALIRDDPAELLLVDINLEGKDGLTITREQRAASRVGIILLTARDDQVDKIVGLEMGADDYVTKPFSVRELVLRVGAGARRVSAPPPRVEGILELGLVRIDQGAHRAYVSGEELRLTATEYRLLVWLATHAGRLCSRGELLKEVWELPPDLNTRTVDTHVKRLRQKLGPAAKYVETVRGAGYRFSQ